MFHKFAFGFVTEEDGAVTVDWVVLTAAIVGIGLTAVTVVAGGVGDVTAAIDNDINQANTYAETVATALQN
jgi:hypothetical protein